MSERGWHSPFAKPGLGQAWPPCSVSLGSNLAKFNLRIYRRIPRGLPYLGVGLLSVDFVFIAETYRVQQQTQIQKTGSSPVLFLC